MNADLFKTKFFAKLLTLANGGIYMVTAVTDCHTATLPHCNLSACVQYCIAVTE